MPIVEIDSKHYAVDGPVRQGWVTRLSPAFRTVGVQTRDDDQSVGRYRHRSFPLGLGWQRMNRENGRGVGGMLDSTCWTALGPVTNGKLEEAHTHSGPVDLCKKMINFNGDFWGLWEESSSGGNDLLLCRKFGATSDDWTGGGTIHTGATTAHKPRGFDMVVHKGSMFELHTESDATPDHVFKVDSSTDGATWSDASGTGWPDAAATQSYITDAICARNNFDDDMGKLLSFGNTLLAAIYRHPDATDGSADVAVLSSTDSGSNWASDVTIPSGDGPKAFVDWYALDATRAPVLITAEGVYSIDVTEDTFELIYALDGDPNNGRWAEIGNDGALYVGLGSGSILRLAITDTNVLVVINIGPPGDGLVSARQGHVNYILKTPTEWLLVAYGGHESGKNASIFMIDTSVILTDPETGKKYMPWHSLYQHSLANRNITAMAYSTEDDATPRLHFSAVGTVTSTDDTSHIEEPFVHPNQSSTVKYQLTSTLRLPDDDFGDPHSTATILQAFVDADDLTAGSGGSGGSGDEFITWRYGINGAADTTTSVGDFLSGTLSQSLGSGVGVAARRIGNNLLFDRSTTNTKTPTLNEFEIQGHHVLIDKRFWEFTINITDSPSPTVVADTPATETIIANVEALAEKTTLFTFQMAENMTQVNVKVPNDIPPQFTLSLDGSDIQNRGSRTGTCRIRLEEGI